MKFQSSKRLGAKQPNCQNRHVETLHFFRMNLQFYVMTTICVIVYLVAFRYKNHFERKGKDYFLAYPIAQTW